MEFNFKKVSITNWSEFIEDKSRNGGCYSFTKTYEPIGYAIINEEYKMMFKVQHYTSSDFDYCKNSGQWGKDEIYFNLVNENELYEILKDAEKYNNLEVKYYK